MNENNKKITITGATILFFIVGIFFIFLSLFSTITGEGPAGQVLIIENTDNLFVKYSPQILMFYLGFISLLIVWLNITSVIPPYYSRASDHDKIKTNVIYGSLFLPVSLSFITPGWLHGSILMEAKIFLLLFICRYFYMLYRFLNNKRD